MKLTRKLLALILCLTMVMGLATTVFADVPAVHADHKHYFAVENNREYYVYTAYQIFKGEVDSTGTLSNVEWGSAIPEAQIDAMMTDLRTIDEFSSCTNEASSVAAVLASLGATLDDPTAIKFADVVGKYASVAVGSSTFDSSTGKHTIYNLNDGYYLVKNTTVPEGANTTFTRYMLKVVADVNITHKGSFPQVTKKIVDEGEKLDANEAFIGEVVNYEIVGTIPENIGVYDTYYYVFKDTLSKGLTYNNDARVFVDGVEVTSYFYKNEAAYTGTGDKYEGGTSITVGIADLLALEKLTAPAPVVDITDNSKVVLTYSATLNEDAVVGGFDGNPNKVLLEYDNDPNGHGAGATTPPPINPTKPTPPTHTGKTPEDEVTTFTTRVTLQKVDGTGKVLTGAEFTLTSDTNVKMKVVTTYTFTEDAGGIYWKLNDGTYTLTAPVLDNPDTTDVNEDTTSVYASTTTKYNVTPHVTVTTVDPAAPYSATAAVDENGLISFTGLGAGDYTLTETKTPAGFNTMDPFSFTVHFAYDAAQERYEFSTSNRLLGQDVDNTLVAEIENVAGSTLPSTGGIGTTVFYLLGSILFIGAVVLLITKKRMSAAE